jgi:hypothetical protein
MAGGPGEWIGTGACVMRVAPASIGVDPIVVAPLHVAAFLQ